MIQLAHVATGALAGRNRSGLRDAFIAGMLTHAAMDVIPHGEVHDDEYELLSGAAGVIAIAARHGWRSPITMGAIGAIVPDMEHLPQKFGIFQPTLFPTHRIKWLHGWETKPLAIPAWVQAVVGGAVIGAFAMTRGRARAGAADRA
ncbi:MAG: hypothetical protein JWM98_557 [Thermoleophilia bacterium]|nr:hypothetical protein [Thermoleophilia bacterium]